MHGVNSRLSRGGDVDMTGGNGEPPRRTVQAPRPIDGRGRLSQANEGLNAPEGQEFDKRLIQGPNGLIIVMDLGATTGPRDWIHHLNVAEMYKWGIRFRLANNTNLDLLEELIAGRKEARNLFKRAEGIEARATAAAAAAAAATSDEELEKEEDRIELDLSEFDITEENKEQIERIRAGAVIIDPTNPRDKLLLKRVLEHTDTKTAKKIRSVSRDFAAKFNEAVRPNEGLTVEIDLGITEGDGNVDERLAFASEHKLPVTFKLNVEKFRYIRGMSVDAERQGHEKERKAFQGQLNLIEQFITQAHEESSEGAGASAAAAAAGEMKRKVKVRGLDFSLCVINQYTVSQISRIIGSLGGELRKLKLGDLLESITVANPESLELRTLSIGCNAFSAPLKSLQELMRKVTELEIDDLVGLKPNKLSNLEILKIDRVTSGHHVAGRRIADLSGIPTLKKLIIRKIQACETMQVSNMKGLKEITVREMEYGSSLKLEEMKELESLTVGRLCQGSICAGSIFNQLRYLNIDKLERSTLVMTRFTLDNLLELRVGSSDREVRFGDMKSLKRLTLTEVGANTQVTIGDMDALERLDIGNIGENAQVTLGSMSKASQAMVRDIGSGATLEMGAIDSVLTLNLGTVHTGVKLELPATNKLLSFTAGNLEGNAKVTLEGADTLAMCILGEFDEFAMLALPEATPKLTQFIYKEGDNLSPDSLRILESYEERATTNRAET